MHLLIHRYVLPKRSVGKESSCNARDPSSIPGLGRSVGEGIGYPFHYSLAFLVAQLVNNPPAIPGGSLSRVQLFVTPWTIQSVEFSRPEYWSGSLSPLQGIFPTQGSSPGLPHCRRTLHQLSHKKSPRILEWVAYPFSNGSS